jgi:hypothetical protein
VRLTIAISIIGLLASCSKPQPAEPKLPPPFSYTATLTAFDRTGTKVDHVWNIRAAQRADGSTYYSTALAEDKLKPQAQLYLVADKKLIFLDPETGARYEKISKAAFRQPKPVGDDCLQEFKASGNATCEPTAEKRFGFTVYRYTRRSEDQGARYELSALVIKELGWLIVEQENKAEGVLRQRRVVTNLTPGDPDSALFDISKYALKTEAEYVELSSKARGQGVLSAP